MSLDQGQIPGVTQECQSADGVVAVEGAEVRVPQPLLTPTLLLSSKESREASSQHLKKSGLGRPGRGEGAGEGDRAEVTPEKGRAVPPRKTLSSAERPPKKPELTSSSLNRSAWVMSFSLMLLKGEKWSCSGEGPPCEGTHRSGGEEGR